MIVLYRIDNRLIHAQVLEAWMPVIQANVVVVANEEMRKDELRRQIATAALAGHAQVYFLSPVEAPAQLEDLSVNPDSKILVIFGSPQDLLAFIRCGGEKPRQINVGGMHYAITKISLGRYRTFSDVDRKALLELHKMGIVLDARATPTDEPVDLLPMLK
ncbi:MAG: PTS sugar transporter subunit IIB [Elusimicrobia bacterium]|nr:PTS sugar transporter subunit IIB [Elusimicrobiota bacterium]